MGRVYRHYGSKEFDPLKFTPIKNRMLFTKPEGGLWGSQIDAEFGWKEWCNKTNYAVCTDENSFIFTLNKTANVLTINSTGLLSKLPIIKSPISMWALLDFEKLLESGVDAIELDLSNEIHSECNWLNGLYYKLYGWDCDCILVMNSEIIGFEGDSY